MHANKLVLFLILSGFFFSCQNKKTNNEVERISLPLTHIVREPYDTKDKSVQTLDFDITQASKLSKEDMECVFIPLETRDECLLTLLFEDVQLIDNRIFIINSHENKARVFVFDRDGRFMAQIGAIGNGPGEYHQPYKLHIDKGKKRIIVADRHLRRLIAYDLNTYQYLSVVSVPFNFDDCTWLSDEQILWCSEGGIDFGKRKWYYACVTDANINPLLFWHETSKSNYPIGYRTLYNYQNKSFTGLPFSPYIYQIDVERQTPVWKLAFGKQKLPPKSLVEDEKENTPAWQSKVVASDYIIAFHAHETTDCLGVSFYGRTFQRHLGFYNKKTQTTHAYAAIDFMKQFDLYGVYDIINTHDDYFVSRIEPRLLKKYSSQREDLHQIEQNMTEEDNPVLCLFKFK